MSDKVRGNVMLLLTAMIWGGGFVAQSAGMDYIGPFTFCAARYVLAGLSGSEFPLSMFFAGAVLNAVPGIILHLALIPVLVIALEKAGLSLNQ